jgi:hypothetical protein
LLIPRGRFTFAGVPIALLSLRRLLVVLTLLVWTSGPALGQDKPTLSVTFGSGSPMYTPGRWMPMRATLTNPTAVEIEGSVHAGMALGGSPLNAVRPVRVPPRSRVSVDFLTAFDAPEEPRGNQRSPPVTIVYWKNAAGATLVQEPVQGVADSSDMGGRKSGSGVPGVLILSVYDQPLEGEEEDAVDLPHHLQPGVEYTFSSAAVAASDLTRRLAALDACRLVVSNGRRRIARRGPTPDPARPRARWRDALLRAAPNLGASWRGEHLPMDTSTPATRRGSRPGVYARCRTAIRRPARLRRRDGATIVAADATGPLASYRPLGLGRVAMVAFPLGTCDPPCRVRAHAVGRMRVASATFHDTASACRRRRPPATVEIGQPAPAWKWPRRSPARTRSAWRRAAVVRHAVPPMAIGGCVAAACC